MNRSDEELLDRLLPGGREMFDLVPVPMLLGNCREEAFLVRCVNRAFEEQMGTPRELPGTLSAAFGSKDNSPFAPEMFLECLVRSGWSHRFWEAIPGERIFDAVVFRHPEGGVLAILPDYSDRVVVRRMEKLEAATASALRNYTVREVFSPLLSAVTETLGVDWAGIFQWIPPEERWTLLFAEENTLLPGRMDWALAFVQALFEEGECSGALLGDLAIEEGGQWWVPWVSSVEGARKELLQRQGVGSLFAGTLLVGSAPMVLLGLSEREGVFARLSGNPLRALLPVFASTAERYRVITGMSIVNDRDKATGLLSRGGVQRFLKQELDKARRYGFPVSCVRVALDNVEAIRKAGGETSFFDALRMIAGIASQCIRTVDVAARSDEATLLLVLPHTPAEGCAVVVNRLRERLEGISPLPGVPLQVTFAHATFAGATLPSPERVLFGEFFHA